MDRLKMALKAPLAPIALPATQAAPLQETVPTVEELQVWVEELMGYMERSLHHRAAIDGRWVEHGLERIMEEVILKDAERTASDVAEFVLQDE